MGFNILKQATTATFWHPVELLITAEDGRKIVGKVKGRFKRFTTEQMEAFTQKHKGVKPSPETLLEILVDWADVDDDAGAMPFTPENLEKLCSVIPSAAASFAQAFFAGLTGAREGN